MCCVLGIKKGVPPRGTPLYCSNKSVIYLLGQAFSQVSALGQAFWQESAFTQASALGQSILQESFISQVAQSILHESAISQVALQHESAATHSVLALSHAFSLALLLQQELMVRAATATIANNTFFIFSF